MCCLDFYRDPSQLSHFTTLSMHTKQEILHSRPTEQQQPGHLSRFVDGSGVEVSGCGRCAGGMAWLTGSLTFTTDL